MKTPAIYRAYDQACLKSVLADVKRHAPNVETKAAWIYKTGRGQYEFHFQEFYWYGKADSAAEARAAGWSAWLTKENAEGYAPEPAA